MQLAMLANEINGGKREQQVLRYAQNDKVKKICRRLRDGISDCVAKLRWN